MLGRPERIDATPDEVYLWTAYEDLGGTTRDLPPHIILTSRGGAGKSHHYALVCHSDDPLAIGDHGPFDHRRCLTLANKVPASRQVTALLHGDLDAGHDGGVYRIAFRARLALPWTAKLVCYRALGISERIRLSNWAGEDWRKLARELRVGAIEKGA